MDPVVQHPLRPALAALTALALAAGVTACGSGGGGPVAGPSGSAEPTASLSGGAKVDVKAKPTGAISVSLPADSPGDIELRKAQAKVFMEQNPGVNVKIVSVPANGYDQKVLTSIAGGNPPDVFAIGEVLIPTLVKSNYALDLKPLMAAQGEGSGDFYPEVLKGLTYDGKLVGLTDNWDTQVMYYNRTLFDKAGLKHPTKDWTWSEYKAAAAKLTSGEGRDKTYGSLVGKWWVPVSDAVAAAGGRVYSEDGKKCALTEPASITGLKHLHELSTSGVDPGDTEDGAMGRTSEEVFTAGKAAMLLQAGRWDAYEFSKAKGLDWAVAPAPKGPSGRSTFFHLAALSIPSNTKNPNAAWQFLRFVTSPAGIKMGLENFSGIPARKSLVSDPAFARSALVTKHNTLQPFLDSLPTARRAPALANFRRYQDKVDAALLPLWKGKSTPEKAAEAACKAVDAELAKG